MSGADAIRKLIARVLSESLAPIGSREIAEMLWFRFKLRVSVASVGVNLGFLRAAGVVDRRSCPVWGKPYWRNGHWHFSTENLWWHTATLSKKDAVRMIAVKRQQVEAAATWNQRMKGRAVIRRSHPITDDMRQMMIDLEATRERKTA